MSSHVWRPVIVAIGLVLVAQPQQAHFIFLTPHFTSAIAAFGMVLLVYGGILAAELWFIYRLHFLAVVQTLEKKKKKKSRRSPAVALFFAPYARRRRCESPSPVP